MNCDGWSKGEKERLEIRWNLGGATWCMAQAYTRWHTGNGLHGILTVGAMIGASIASVMARSRTEHIDDWMLHWVEYWNECCRVREWSPVLFSCLHELSARKVGYWSYWTVSLWPVPLKFWNSGICTYHNYVAHWSKTLRIPQKVTKAWGWKGVK